MCSTPDRVVRVRDLAGDIVLCSWARHFTPTVPLSTQVYKWVPAKCWGVTLRWHPIQLLAKKIENTSCVRLHATGTGISSGSDGPLGSGYVRNSQQASPAKSIIFSLVLR